MEVEVSATSGGGSTAGAQSRWRGVLPGLRGVLVASGRTSQYTWGKDGRSACTSIALIGALRLLRLRNAEGVATLGLADEPYASANQQLIDNLVADGVSLAQQRSSVGSATEHIAVDELMQALPDTHELLCCLERKTLGFGVVKQKAETIKDFSAALAAAPGAAFVITKPPETLLVLTGDVSAAANSGKDSGGGSSGAYYLFDSHPRPPVYNEAHLLRFESVDDLCRELVARFSPQEMEAESLQESMLSMWQSHAFTLVADAAIASVASSPSSRASGDPAALSVAVPLLVAGPFADSGAAPSTPARQPSASHHQQRPLTENERRTLSCPIMQMGELIANPVVAADGHVYERRTSNGTSRRSVSVLPHRSPMHASAMMRAVVPTTHGARTLTHPWAARCKMRLSGQCTMWFQ